ncbi:MAG: DUF655 domain-containing protein [Planctomycetota bacterium]
MTPSRGQPARLPRVGPASWAGGGAAAGAAAVGLAWAISSTRVPPADFTQAPKNAATPAPTEPQRLSEPPSITRATPPPEAGATPERNAQPASAHEARPGPSPTPSPKPIAEPEIDDRVFPTSIVPAEPSDPEPPEDPAPLAGKRIHINAATVAQLELLPRIGPVIAQRIIDERDSKGPFTSLDDLQQRVAGIGPKTAERLAPLIVFD